MSHPILLISGSIKPSQTLISYGDIPSIAYRMKLLDTCAEILESVLENRSDQCLYFALLVQYGLRLIQIESDVFIGRAKYTYNDQTCRSFSWDHAWVVCGDDMIDGNVDAFAFNPKIPSSVRPFPYWGPKALLPSDRLLKPYGLVEECGSFLMDGDNKLEECKKILQLKLKSTNL